MSLSDPSSRQPRTIVFINQKGGVGKTTACVSVAGALRELGKKVLLIDLDSQASLSNSFGIFSEEEGNTVYELLKGTAKIDECIRRVHGLFIIPSSIELANGEVEFISEPGREFLLKRAIEKRRQDFDYILIDCPPFLGVMTQNGLSVADHALIVFRPDNYSMLGTARLMEMIEIIQERLNPGLSIVGLLANGFDMRNGIDREVLKFFQEKFPDLVFNQVVRNNVRLREMPAQKADVFIYSPDAPGAQDFLGVAKELIQRSGENHEQV